MNTPNQKSPCPPADSAAEALDRWAAAVTPAQHARLAAARAAAIGASGGTSRRGAHPRWIGSALAAGVLLALGLGFWPHPAGQAPAGATVAAEEQQQDDDLDLLLWMNSDDAS